MHSSPCGGRAPGSLETGIDGTFSAMKEALDVPGLPRDLFMIIIDYLDPWDLVRCRRVSHSWHRAFADPDNLRIVLKHRFPRAREVRLLKDEGAFAREPCTESDDIDWRALFDRVTARYFHLTHAKPRSIQRYKLLNSLNSSSFDHWFPVCPWEYHQSQHGSGNCTVFDHAFWTVDDGLLVFLDFATASLVMVDLEYDTSFQVPFELGRRVVRNLRLRERLLICEWSEDKPFHWLNETESVYRHFASSYEIVQSSGQGRWSIVFRSEWKLHFLGLPLNERDRFFSVHNAQHYAIYFWQPNRSMYTGEEDSPIESLFIWDISMPSSYNPSEDPSGRSKPSDDSKGPHIVQRFSFRELDFYSVRQRGTPSLMKLELDSEAETISLRENVCIDEGFDVFDPADRYSWREKTTTIPFIGEGPCLQREGNSLLPPYHGSCSMETCDELSRDGWSAGIMNVLDELSGVRYSLQGTLWDGDDDYNWQMLMIRFLYSPASFEETILAPILMEEIAHKGKICGDERFVIGENSNQELVVLRFDR